MGCRKEQENNLVRQDQSKHDREDDIFAAARYGFTEEQLDNPREALLSGGLKEFFNARQALMARAIRKWGRAPNENAPAWQSLSGLTPDVERSAPPDEREALIAEFLRGVTKMLRHELYREKTRWAQQNEINALKNGRTRHWDPIRSVCFQLEISQNKLSSYSKEVMGMSASEIVDCIRAESVRATMKISLKKFVAEFFARGGTDRTGEGVKGRRGETERRRDGETGRRGDAKGCQGAAGSLAAPCCEPSNAVGTNNSTEQSRTAGVDPWHLTVADEIFRALKMARREGRYHRTTRANELGFSSYTRFFRACLNCFGVTPQELEMALIEEILCEADDVPGKDAKTQRDGIIDGVTERQGEEVVSEVGIVRRE